MAFPPPVLPVNFTNATPQVDAHPANHNAVSQAVNDITTWVKPAGRLLYVAQPYTGTPFGTTLADIPGSAVALNAPAGTRYFMHCSVFGHQSVAGEPTLQITDNANTIIAQTSQTVAAGGYVAMNVTGYVLAGASPVTYKLRAKASAGTWTMSQAANWWVITYGPA